MLIIIGLGVALATEDFDPEVAAETFTGEETWSLSGETHLWSAIERLEDPDRDLFAAEAFNAITEWPTDNMYMPYIATCFGTSQPGSGAALLHAGVNVATATGTPVLFVPGAGDNASRGFMTMAASLDLAGKPVYAITFAHPHGDAFMQAEALANAIARVRVLTGADQVDLVSHSKGGIAAAIYLSHTATADWGNPAYEAVGTPYRGDVRRAVFIATPLGGIDSGYRWSNMNLVGLSAETAMAPTSWALYYPYGTGYSWVYQELYEQDFLPDDGDLFPGQRQLLARQDHPLPGELPWLGSYAVQLDYWTTYEGGLGFYSWSDGIDEAIDAGGGLIARLHDQGVDPAVELYLLAGESPLMPNGAENLLAEVMGEMWVELATVGVDVWAAFIAEIVGDGLVSVGVTEDEIAGLAAGKVILGEITGPSDGLVFVESATDEGALDARGASVMESRVVELSHLDLLYASAATAAAMRAQAEDDPLDYAWMGAFADRYEEADTVGWLAEVLADPADEDTGDGGSSGGSSGGGSSGGGSSGGGSSGGSSSGGSSSGGGAGAEDTGIEGTPAKDGGCSHGGGLPGGAGLALALAGLVARRRGRAREGVRAGARRPTSDKCM